MANPNAQIADVFVTVDQMLTDWIAPEGRAVRRYYLPCLLTSSKAKAFIEQPRESEEAAMEAVLRWLLLQSLLAGKPGLRVNDRWVERLYVEQIPQAMREPEDQTGHQVVMRGMQMLLGYGDPMRIDRHVKLLNSKVSPISHTVGQVYVDVLDWFSKKDVLPDGCLINQLDDFYNYIVAAIPPLADLRYGSAVATAAAELLAPPAKPWLRLW